MQIIDTKIEDVKIFEPIVHCDDRGYFFETYRDDEFEKLLGKKIKFCQENESKSVKGTIRGLHYQLSPYAQTKLVRVISGKVLDIAVDIRKGSSTFCQYVAVELDGQNKKQLFIPRGFAHAFIVLSEEAIVAYKVDNYYNKESERGIIYDDKTIAIEWLLNETLIKISEKDIQQPSLKNTDLFNINDKLYV